MARELLPDLRRRRRAMPAAAARYYQVLQTEATVVGTDAAERFVVQGVGPGRLRLQVWAQRPTRPDSLLGEQEYAVQRTRRLRIYGLGGNDRFELRGPLAPGFALWLDGGSGLNHFTQLDQNSNMAEGVTVYATAHDQLHLDLAVRVCPPSSFANAAAWICSQYRLGLGNRPTAGHAGPSAPPTDANQSPAD